MEKSNVQWPGWEVKRLIGNGSFGAVYEIQRDLFGSVEKAALKVIRIPQSDSDIEELYNDGFDDESITARFHSYLEDIIREYALMARMKGNKNVVYCDDVRQIQHDNGIGWDIYIKMELLTPLVKTLGKTVPEETVLDIGIDMCSALVLCSEHGIIHRDIKPQNIFVAPDGTYKLGDFGIAKTAERTTSGTKTGTYKYMAPEVYKSLPYGAAVDQYSLGMVLYWLLNERRTPFLPLPSVARATTLTMEDEARKRRFDGEQIPPPAHGSKRLQEIVMKAIAYEPKNRFRNASEMLQALKQLRDGANTYIDGHAAGGLAAAEGPGDLTVRAAGTQTTGAATEELTARASDTSVSAAPEDTSDLTTGVRSGLAAGFVAQQADSLSSAAIRQTEQKKVSETVPEISDVAQSAKGPDNVSPEELTARAGGDRSDKSSADQGDRTVGAFQSTDAEKPEDATVGAFHQGRVAKQPEKKTLKTDAQAGSSANTSSGAAVSAAIREGQTPQEKKKKRTPVLWIALGAGVLAVVGIVILLLNGGKKDNNTESSAAPVSAGVVSGWTDWSDELPDNVTEDGYEIEKRELYSSRQLETAQSTESDEMEGWELFYTAVGDGEYGAWSDWSQTKPEESEGRDIEVQTRYRYSDKETTTGSSDSMEGWTLEDSKTEWGSYGAWSSWSDTAVSKSDSREVETQTRYRYRDKEKTTSTSASLSGWTRYGETTSQGDWGSWSGWSTNAISGNDSTQVETKTQYSYRDKNYTTSDSSNLSGWTQYDSRVEYGSWSSWSQTPVSASSTVDVETKEEIVSSGSDAYSRQYYRYREIRRTYYYYSWSAWSEYSDTAVSSGSDREVRTRTVYRSRTRAPGTTTYKFYRWKSWSDWSASAVTGNDNREVQTKTVYRYRDRKGTKTYVFSRWTEWSEWSETAVEESKSRKVETTEFYRFRDRVYETTYFFRRWTEWTEFSGKLVEESETTEVQTKTQYRYRSKENAG